MKIGSASKMTLVFSAIGLLLASWGSPEAMAESDMVLIPYGEFTMGGPMHSDAPAHPIVLDAYYIDKYEVSNEKFARFMKATDHSAPAYWDDHRFNKPNHPVVGVNWYDANAFCEWEGKRLPTEAEWEKAAKGPDGDSHYPWGHQFDPKKLNCCQNVGSTTPVNSFKEGVSGYGVYNMVGNVYEWVADWYDHRYYEVSPALNPKGPKKGYKWGALGEMKVIRGGSWFAPKSSQHSSHRFWNQPENNSYGVGLGFRCAKDAPRDSMEQGRIAFNNTLIHMATEKYDQALSAIEQALGVDPNNPEYLELQIEIKKQLTARKR